MTNARYERLTCGTNCGRIRDGHPRLAGEPQRAVGAARRASCTRTCAVRRPTSSVRAVVLTHTGHVLRRRRSKEALDADRAAAAAHPADARAAAGDRRACRSRWSRGSTAHVRAGGIGLVGACDIVVAGPASTFAFTEARLGLAPSIISLTLLPRHDRPRGRALLPHRRDLRRRRGRARSG